MILRFLQCVIILITFSTFTLDLVVVAQTTAKVPTEEEGIAYLQQLDPFYSRACNAEMTARWDYITNVTDHNAQKATEALNAFLAFQAEKQAEILEKFGTEWQEWSDPTRREFKYLAIKGPATMNPEDVDKMNNLKSKMETVYATAKVCEYKNPSNCELRLDPEISEKLATSEDYDELAYYWTAWHDAMSAGVSTADYKQFAAYQTQMAAANGYPDMGTLWMQNYDTGEPSWSSDSFKQEMLDIWKDLKPYYSKLHAYVRMKLRKDPILATKIKKYGYLPANLMGNMWSQDWAKLDALTKPYPNAPSLDATEAMKEIGWTPEYLFNISDDFFASMGLDRMTDTFWEKSMLVRPADGRDVVCHASAEDFCMGPGNEDFRIKQCTQVTHDQLVTVHHEMGHIEYFQLYTDHHFAFRTSANDGFHEAIGDALALAVTTPKHLQCYLGLNMSLELDCNEQIPKGSKSTKAATDTDINSLYMTALTKLVFFPFAISMDAWRWEVFDGSLQEKDYNARWWELRTENQGIVPPLGVRDNTKFDPAAKYHIVANVEYLRYFISHIVQFQFYEAMCIAAGEFDPDDPNTKPLYQCDFAGSLEAGAKLRAMMELGFSRPWPEALFALTGSRNMSVTSMLNYLKPLFDLMDERLAEAGEVACFGSDCQAEAKKYLAEKYEVEASKLANELAEAEWTYQTNVTEENAAAAVEASIAWSNFTLKEWRETISQFDWESFDDSDLTKRQFKFLSYVGTAALSAADLARYNQVLTEMQTIYSTAKICPYNKQNCNLESEGWALNPEMENVLATSKNYDELAYVWTGWRNVTGVHMRNFYNEYLDLSQKAADAEGFDNFGDFWILRYESDTFRADMKALWDGVKPLYDELHAFVRHRLSLVYPGKIKDGEPIPAHVLGNMWAQSWEHIYQHVIPFENDEIFDITPYLVANYPHTKEGVTDLFNVANDFFLQSGLSDMGMSYKDPPGKGMIIRPTDGREVVCHASAWDFSNGEDFRIKMCTNINMQDFITIHHELGHIQYDINYKGLPITLREGANPGFHEAIGDVLSLSVATPKHMAAIGFMNASETTPGSTLNYLMKMALEKVSFLPFGFLIDSYRWKLFDGSIPRQNLTYNWMQMRSDFQGIIPPSIRTEMDFDAGSKYHVPANTPYIRYFVSFILQFQIHKVLCTAAGEYDPENPGNGGLHECDIYKNAEAGKIFKNILESGASVNWQDLLESVTGNRNLDPSAIKEYFEPLMTYMKAERERLRYNIGWRVNAFEEMFQGENPPERSTVDPNPDPSTADPNPSEPPPPPAGASTIMMTISTVISFAMMAIMSRFLI